MREKLRIFAKRALVHSVRVDGLIVTGSVVYTMTRAHDHGHYGQMWAAGLLGLAALGGLAVHERNLGVLLLGHPDNNRVVARWAPLLGLASAPLVGAVIWLGVWAVRL